MSNRTHPTFTHLGNITITEFLTQYWQKKPLLIRKAFPCFESPISADELAGLALEDDVNSRLVIQKSANTWEVEHGPLPEERFAELPENDWTLLVQHVDSLNPEVNELLNAFRFIPNWRLDDIMVSYATDNGGVGPHFDYFDVFLLQGEGKRRWRVGQRCDSRSKLVPDQPMKILEQFDTSEDWTVEPGDLLYIPAQTAHWGEAIGESVTYSIGFRSPSDTELLLDYSQEVSTPLTNDNRFTDPDLTEQENAGEISESAMQKIIATLQKYASDKNAVARWLGEYSTQLKCTTETIELPLDYISVAEFKEGEPGQLSPFARSAYIDLNNLANINLKDPTSIDLKKPSNDKINANEAYCFINGSSYACSLTLAKLLCSAEAILCEELPTTDQQVMCTLLDADLIIYAD